MAKEFFKANFWCLIPLLILGHGLLKWHWRGIWVHETLLLAGSTWSQACRSLSSDDCTMWLQRLPWLGCSLAWSFPFRSGGAKVKEQMLLESKSSHTALFSVWNKICHNYTGHQWHRNFLGASTTTRRELPECNHITRVLLLRQKVYLHKDCVNDDTTYFGVILVFVLASTSNIFQKEDLQHQPRPQICAKATVSLEVLQHWPEQLGLDGFQLPLCAWPFKSTLASRFSSRASDEPTCLSLWGVDAIINWATTVLTPSFAHRDLHSADTIDSETPGSNCAGKPDGTQTVSSSSTQPLGKQKGWLRHPHSRQTADCVRCYGHCVSHPPGSLTTNICESRPEPRPPATTPYREGSHMTEPSSFRSSMTLTTTGCPPTPWGSCTARPSRQLRPSFTQQSSPRGLCTRPAAACRRKGRLEGAHVHSGLGFGLNLTRERVCVRSHIVAKPIANWKFCWRADRGNPWKPQ